MIVRPADPENMTQWDPARIIAGMESGERIYGIFAVDEDGLPVTDEIRIAEGFRYLRLTEAFRKELAEQGYRWVFFRVGDKALLIDLTELEEEGDYIFALDPESEEGLTVEDAAEGEEEPKPAIAAAWHGDERILVWDEDGVLYEELTPVAILLSIEDEPAA